MSRYIQEIGIDQMRFVYGGMFHITWSDITVEEREFCGQNKYRIGTISTVHV